jgi:hypothetical protein
VTADFGFQAHISVLYIRVSVRNRLAEPTFSPDGQ